MLESLRLMLHECDSPPDLAYYSGWPEGFILLQQATNPDYYKQSLTERVNVAFSMVYQASLSGPSLLELALGEGLDFATIASLEDDEGRNILHVIASQIGYLTEWIVHSDRVVTDIVETLQEKVLLSQVRSTIILKVDIDLSIGWRQFLKSLLPSTVDLYRISDYGWTPLLELINATCNEIIFDWGSTPSPVVLNDWLDDLYSSGVDS